MPTKTLKDLQPECNIGLFHGAYVVRYKNVVLWSTIYPHLKDTHIELVMDEYDGVKYITILGRTPVMGMEDEYDFSTYGDWHSEAEAEEWLENPVPLY